jgi:Tfp pilus assembly protein PilN
VSRGSSVGLLVLGSLMVGLWGWLAADASSSTVIAPTAAVPASDHPVRVDAASYRQFWLWAGVTPQPVLHQAQRLYLLQGHISQHGDAVSLQPQGLPPSTLKVPELWLSYRVATLDWQPGVVRDLLRQRTAWQAKGNRVIGIQIDFDAATPRLAGYADFLRQLRQQLPADCQLGITGLLDWSANGDVTTLNGLSGVVDELVVQTYRGRTTVDHYEQYLPALRRLTLPFKLGLVQDGVWNPDWQRQFASQPNYRGEVVFLLNAH